MQKKKSALDKLSAHQSEAGSYEGTLRVHLLVYKLSPELW